MKIGITPRFENSRYGDPWYSYEVNLMKLMKTWKRDCELELLSPQNDIKFGELTLVILSGGATPGENSQRDDFENGIIKKSVENNAAILGICRGAQLIAKYFGGSLMQISNHIDTSRPLSGIVPYLGKCFHTNAISHLPPNFEVLGKDSIDGTCEIFLDENRKLLGIMNHPERVLGTDSLFFELMEKIRWQ